MEYKIIDFDVKGDSSGSLIALESNKDIPFDIKRVYYVYDTQDSAIRGKHAHRKLEQVIICISGECDFILDDGKKRETIHLNSPTQGLHITHNTWREFTNFTKNSVILVLASELYDETDYIRDYNQFLCEVNR